jgi:hypothetical protein
VISVGRRRLLFLALGHLSNGDISIAADFARQLPAAEFEVRFVTAAAGAPYVRALGLPAHPLDGGRPQENLAAFDEIMADYRPEAVIAADAFTLDYSTAWSGLSMEVLRQRYDAALASFDQYDYPAADYLVDFYPDYRIPFPRLLEACDFIIRNSPLNRPAPHQPGVIVSRVTGADSAPPASTRRPGNPPTVFLTNSHWESVNVVQSLKPMQLMRSLPRIFHSHLAGLERLLRVIHVGPTKWEFPIAPQIEYQHLTGLEPAEFQAQLANADLFLSSNAVSITLTKAVFAGVPSLVLQNETTLRVGDLPQQGSEHAWLADAAPDLAVAYPFRVSQWGWYQFLTPVLADNPYTDCYLTAAAFDRDQVLGAMTALLDQTSTRAALAAGRVRLGEQLAQLTPAGEALHTELDRVRTGRG